MAAMPAVTWKTEGALTRLTLSNPAKLNALGADAAREFAAAVAAIAQEKSRVVLLSGEGKAFCAGGDLDFIDTNRAKPKVSLGPLMRDFYRSFLSIRNLPQVTVAKVQGAAVGAGLCLALACDLRLVAPDAKLGFNFVRLGLNPGMAAWPLARAAFGEARAKELLLLGRFFSGRELAAWGAAVEATDNLDVRAEELVAELLVHAPTALRLAKKETALGEDLEVYLTFEAEGQARCFTGEEIAEGVRAIKEKRAPRF